MPLITTTSRASSITNTAREFLQSTGTQSRRGVRRERWRGGVARHSDAGVRIPLKAPVQLGDVRWVVADPATLEQRSDGTNGCRSDGDPHVQWRMARFVSSHKEALSAVCSPGCRWKCNGSRILKCFLGSGKCAKVKDKNRSRTGFYRVMAYLAVIKRSFMVVSFVAFR